MRAAPLALAALLPATLAACGSPTGGVVNPDEIQKEDPGACDADIYPCGPKGTGVGSVVANLQLVGKRDDNGNRSPVDDAPRALKLSTYFQDKNVRVLVVLAAAEWCQPCRLEQPELKRLHEAYESTHSGVTMVEAIVQDNDGKPADITVSDRWFREFQLAFDESVDPGEALAPYYDISAFPMQMVLRTSDMTIHYQNNGLATAQLKSAIDQVLRLP